MKTLDPAAEEEVMPHSSAEPSPALAVTRWKRYGKDRLYVATPTGERVGWFDLLTGEATIEMVEHTEAFQQAISGRRPARETHASRPERTPAIAGGGLAASPVSAVVEAPVPDWTDLAENRPGQAVRAKAESLLADMKTQSRVRTFLKRAFDVKTDERAFRVGADGEEAVGARLDRLTKHGAHVLHSIPVGSRGSDIDHLVISKGGVYPVNTKRHPGGRVWVGAKAILVNGQRTDYLRNSRYEADRVRKTLLEHLGVEVPVRAVLVFLTGALVPDVTIKQMPEDVLVLDRMDIPGVFKRAPERLTPGMIEKIYAVARRSTTWTG